MKTNGGKFLGFKNEFVFIKQRRTESLYEKASVLYCHCYMALAIVQDSIIKTNS